MTEFINKYNFPFLFIEYRDDLLKIQGAKTKKYLEEILVYLIVLIIFTKTWLTIEQVLKLKSINLYNVYSKFMD